ncbi:MAG: hypothetical protein IRY99_04360 [Isosphaeraceae bacterium]|nr:hypothetical protein [Isosphaeraceae bacterium]
MNDLRRRLPWGLIGALALVAGGERFVARHPLDFTNTATLSWRLSEHAARREATRGQILCLGDSLVKHGLLPAVIETRSGRTAYNLSICAAQAPASFFLLRRALEAGARPSAVVIDLMPDLLAGGPRYPRRNWPELADLRDAIDLALTARDASLLASTLVGLALPSARGRDEIRAVIRAILRGQGHPHRAANLAHHRNWRVNLGAEFCPPNPAFQGAVTEDQHRKLLSHAFWCHPVHRAYIHRLLDLAAAHDITIFWLLPPVSPQVQARREQTGADEKQAAFLRSFLPRHPNLVVLDARRSGYGPSVFLDPIHLDGRGGIALSLAVADAIARPGPGRWIKLPAYQDPSLDRPFEDIEQSRLALEGQAMRR